MTPAFDSVSAFLSMDGYAPYVWTCYGAFFLCLGLLTLISMRRRRAVETHLRRVWKLADQGSTAEKSMVESESAGQPFGQVDESRP